MITQAKTRFRFFAFIYFCSLFAKRCAKNKPFKQKSNLSNEKIGAFAAAQQNRRVFALICSIWFSVVHTHANCSAH
jgi:hypothetical protein